MSEERKPRLFPDYHDPLSSILGFEGVYPELQSPVFMAAGSRVVGNVRIGWGCSIWYNAVIRGDVHSIQIGEICNVQDGAVLHVTHDTHPLWIGRGVTIGHGAVVHGCRVEEFCLIGIGARVLDGAVVEPRSFVAAGAVVTPGFRVPAGSLVAGVPARVMRMLSDEETADIEAGAWRYVGYAGRSIQSIQEARPRID